MFAGKTLIREAIFAASKIRVVRRTLSLLYAMVNRKQPGMLHHPIDEDFGIETSGFQPGVFLRSGRLTDRDVTGYEPIQHSTMARVVENIEDPRDYTFVDIGCGKGRALILASALGFQRIVGVEMSPDLFAVAQENIRKFSSIRPGEAQLEVIHGDATEFRLPPGGLLILLFNPFGAHAMTLFRSRIEAAHREQQRRIVVAYVNPVQADVLEGMDGFSRVHQEWVPVGDTEKAFSRYDRFEVICWRNGADAE